MSAFVEQKLFCSIFLFIYRKKHPNLKAIFALVMETVNHRENLEELAERVNLWTQVLFKGTLIVFLFSASVS
jgi:hypothetical protein